MSAPIVLFPHQPFSSGVPDSEFASEYEAARWLGFSIGFYSHEDVEAGSLTEALTGLPPGKGQLLILRGWMLAGESYALLYAALLAKGYSPAVEPVAYEEAHYLPLAYRHLVGETSRSAWIEGENPEEAWELYQGFRTEDAIIKDWVKSAKAKWKDACYLPAHTERERFLEMFSIFRRERGKLFNRGVVIREFLPIVERGSDVGGLPVIEEVRLFFWQGKVVVPPQGRSPNPMDERERWEEIARRFQSRFITMDVVYLTDGTWKIVEVGDAGVSGLPITLDAGRFFAALWNHLQEDASGSIVAG
ncbi:ATP-grasp domain-containing protein [Roseibacillus persicicus]|uniref:ATP-grasp domain-containing protein n=1 Tax=Roseibacillus persicicus TaxID=454148 RepID=A0A918WK98_9BACT|nr:ATP-grasp domain-containing protein [Roseibacillus persicicus]GHC54038.1 hypothetical protein GCM10007100_20440 [Roseibacillus persicicus]